MRRVACLAVLTLGACQEAPPDHAAIPGADAARGKRLVAAYGCGACHIVPGIGGAIGKTGPSLEGWSGRSHLAGALANTPANLVAFLRDPPAHRPRTAMPALGLDESEARDIAAFLLALGPGEGQVRPPLDSLDPASVRKPLALPRRGPF